MYQQVVPRSVDHPIPIVDNKPKEEMEEDLEEEPEKNSEEDLEKDLMNE